MIELAGKDGKSAKLWEEVQEALNKICRELFLSQGFCPLKVRIALDDEKVHLHFSTKLVRKDKHFLLGTKSCQHMQTAGALQLILPSHRPVVFHIISNYKQ